MSEPCGDALVDMLAADGAVTAPSVRGELVRDQLEAGASAGPPCTRVERWVEPAPGSLQPGHWELVEVRP